MPPFIAFREAGLAIPFAPKGYWLFDEFLRLAVLFFLGEGKTINITMPTGNNPDIPDEEPPATEAEETGAKGSGKRGKNGKPGKNGTPGKGRAKGKAGKNRKPGAKGKRGKKGGRGRAKLRA